MVGFDPDLVIRHELDRALAAHGAEPVVVMEFDNIETIKRAVEIDAGVALLPEPTVGRELAAGTLCHRAARRRRTRAAAGHHPRPRQAARPDRRDGSSNCSAATPTTSTPPP